MKSKLVILKSEILRDIEKLGHLFEKFEASYKRYEREKDYAVLVESAYLVNQIYTGFERIFSNIATSFENSISETSWHQSLLDRMTLNIENIRPAVFSETNYRHLNELRAFRHFFRHAYDIDLEEKKFAIVAAATQQIKTAFKTDLLLFLSFLDQLIN